MRVAGERDREPDGVRKASAFSDDLRATIELLEVTLGERPTREGSAACPACGNDLQGLHGERWVLEDSNPDADPYRLATLRCACGALRADGRWYAPMPGADA